MMEARHILLAGLAAGALGLGGCVERRLVIGSEPSGALLLLNDREVGRTPISVPIEWDGDYDVRLRHEKNVGTPENPKIVHYYLHTHQKTVVPWYEIIPIDLAAELLPVRIQDEQAWGFVIPQVPEPTDAELIERARALKAQMDAAAPGGGKQ
jgi:hypothetical protein